MKKSSSFHLCLLQRMTISILAFWFECLIFLFLVWLLWISLLVLHWNIEWGFQGGSVIKKPPADAGDAGSVPQSGRSLGEGMSTYSSILAWKSMDRGVGQTAVHRVTKSWTWPSDWASYIKWENGMLAILASVLI